MTRGELLEKIRALYALAESQNANEASAALKAADALIQKYRVEQSELEPKPIFGLSDDPVYHGPNMAVWRRIVLGALCHRYGCHSIVDRSSGWFVYGSDDDRALVRVMFDRVCLQVEAMAVRNALGRGRAYADSYRTGIALTVRRLCQEPDPTPAEPGTALARLDNRGAEAQAALEQEFRGLTKIEPPAKTLVTEAFNAGKEAGKHVHLGESLDGGAKRALPAGPDPLPGWEEE